MRRWTLVLAWAVVGCDGPEGAGFDDTDDTVVDTDPGDTQVVPTDADGDGFAAADDCDDGDARVHPHAPERCNELDDDCDGVADVSDRPLASPTWFGPMYEDADRDGYGPASTASWSCADPGQGWTALDGDCDDADANAFPGGASPCDDPVGACGDGTLDPDEACDDGDTTDGDGCDAACEREHCGDGVTQAALAEACDDGNLIDGDGCDAACAEERCGDGALQPGLGEGCDDGDTTDGDGCSAGCASETCGDDTVDGANGETCDDGAAVDGDGCSSICRFEDCGDGVVEGGEGCDDGDRVEGDGCSAACELERFVLVPVRATIDPLEETSGIEWDYLESDKPADALLTFTAGGVLRLRAPVVLNDNTPAWSVGVTVDVTDTDPLQVRLVDFDATTDPDFIAAWTVDAGTLRDHVGDTLNLTSSMVDDLTIEVRSPW